MLENNRDEINFHKFLRSVRKSQRISMERLSLGVCTKSEVSKVEKGTRLPEKLVRDRLTARLGISGEEYEEYLTPREYVQWEHRMEIIRCINKKNVTDAEEKIAAYENTYNDNSVDIQFTEAMKFMLLEMKGASEEELFTQVSKALACTVSDMDAALGGAHPLADQELNLIMEYVRLRKELAPERNLTEWRLEEYHKIVRCVEKSHLDRIARAKVCSKLACFVSEEVLSNYATEESIHYALELCTRSIEVLRDTVRLYYFVELNEYRMKLVDKLRELALEENKSIDDIYHISEEWATLLSEMYTENELPIYMENFTHLYTETECNDVCDVIRIRRKMMGMSRVRFCKNICDEKTLSRIEKKEVNPSMAVARDLLERAGLCAEYKRARVITSDVEALHLVSKLIMEMNAGKYKAAFEIYKVLYNKIDMDISFNEQEMRRIEAMILINNQRISSDEYREKLIDILECTLAIDALKSKCDIYLSQAELSCVHDFAMYTEGEAAESCKKYLERLCEQLIEMDDIETGRLCAHELIMAKCADYIGSDGKHVESIKISRKLLKESLRNRRMTYLTNSEYNLLWNYQKLTEFEKKPDDNMHNYKSLMKGLLLSELVRKSNWKNFFQQKLQSYSEITLQ